MSYAPLENDRGMLTRRYSGWRKILRVTALILRFIHNARQKDKVKRRVGRALSVKDTSEAVNFWAKIAQGGAYKAEFECIRSGDKQLPSKSQHLGRFWMNMAFYGWEAASVEHRLHLSVNTP